MLKRFKRWMAAMLSVFLLIGAVQLPVFAAETEAAQMHTHTEEAVEEDVQLPAEEAEQQAATSAQESETVEALEPRYSQLARPGGMAKRDKHKYYYEYEEYMLGQIKSCPSSIDISKFKFSYTQSALMKFVSIFFTKCRKPSISMDSVSMETAITSQHCIPNTEHLPILLPSMLPAIKK